VKNKRKVLITGANGFVGSHLIEYILKNHPDYIVCAVHRSHRSSMKNVEHIKSERVKWIECDLTDSHSVEQLFLKDRYERIFHLAAQSYVPMSYKAPTHTLQVNIIGTVNLFEAVRKYNRLAIVMNCSSSEVYGHSTRIPTREIEPFDPISPYALSKCGQDLAGRTYAKMYNLKIVTSRAFTHTGARRGEVFFASSFAKQIAEIEAGLRKPIVYVGNLKSQRTIMNVKDCVRAYWMLTEKGIPGEAYNIGGEETWKVGDVLNHLISISTVKDIEYRIDINRLRPKDVNVQRPRIMKFQELTGWKPEISVEDTLQELLDYWREEIKNDENN